MKRSKQITIGITAHVDAGKTTLSEAMLYLTGELRQPGRVDHGSAFLDDDPIERERGITIFSRQARFSINTVDVTLIDTPGHVDFSAETERSLWVLDYALLVISGSEGVQAHTKTLARMLKDRGIPVFVFVNKMDIAIKSKDELVETIISELDIPAVDFTGAAQRTEKFIDDVTLCSAQLAEAVLENMLAESGDSSAGEQLPGDKQKSDADQQHGANQEYGTDQKAGANQIISDTQIADAVAAGEIAPVMFGSALKMEGVEELLEVIRRYTKDPIRKSGSGAKGTSGTKNESGAKGKAGTKNESGAKGKAGANEETDAKGGSGAKDEPGTKNEIGTTDEFGAKVYKVMTGKDGERLAFMKITSGTLKVRDTVVIRSGSRDAAAINSGSRDTVVIKKGSTTENKKNDSEKGISKNDDQREAKVNQIRLYQGGRFETTDKAETGTVCAVTGLGDIMPGAALGAEDPVWEYSNEPFMVYAIEVPDGKDPHAVMEDMLTLTSEDPALGAAWSAGGSEILIKIMGEVQLEILQRIIKERFGYEVGFGQGRVLYLETITDTYEGVGHFEPLRHYAEVHLVISPGTRGSGITITSDVSEDELALNWQRLIWTHLEEKAHTGVLTGAPLTDLKISIAAGRAHLKHTMGGDFREATYRAVRNAMMQARRDGNVLLLEPWCEYEIELPAKDLGRAITDIKQMGGTQQSLEQGETTAVIKGRVPSAKIEPYRQVLTGYTSGEGKLQVTQCGYDAACDAEAVIEEIGYEAERDTENPADSVFVSHTGSDIVRWDEVPEHMHIASVLRARGAAGSVERANVSERSHANTPGSGAATGSSQNRSSGTAGWNNSADAKEAARRRMAAEKDLKRIFEMTYGPAKRKKYIESTTITSDSDEVSEGDAASGGMNAQGKNGSRGGQGARGDNAARNEEIKAKHEKRRERNSSGAGKTGNDEKGPLILIDGYNLIFADEELKELSARDVGAARDSLIERLVNYAGYTGVEVKLVFDAYKVVPGDGSKEEHSGVEVIYTAANELADVKIGRMASEAANRQNHGAGSRQSDSGKSSGGRHSSRQIYVVSSDRLVQQDVWTKGAMRISSREFLTLLNSTEEEIRRKLKGVKLKGVRPR